MIKNSKLFSKRLAILLSCIMVFASTWPLTRAKDEIYVGPATQESLGYVGTVVTTGGACNLIPIPITTPQMIEVVFYADTTTIETTTGSMLRIDVEVGGLVDANMFEVELEYDAEKLTCVETVLPLEGSVVIDKHHQDGKMKMSFGTTTLQDLQEGKRILSLQFQSSGLLEEGERLVFSLNQCDVITIDEADQTTYHKGVSEPKLIEIEVIGGKASLDINQDGRITLEDLSIAVKYYGIKKGDDLWVKAKKCDVTGDGIIDLADLIAIRVKI